MKDRWHSPDPRWAMEARVVLAVRDGGLQCAYCGEPEWGPDLVLDHVVPWCRGGLDTLENRVLACRSCDDDKADFLPSEWRPGWSWGNATIDSPPESISSRQPLPRRRLGWCFIHWSGFCGCDRWRPTPRRSY